MMGANPLPVVDPIMADMGMVPTSDVAADFFASTAPLRQSEIDFLLERGVPPLAFCNDDGEDGWAVSCAFVAIDAGLFDFASEGDEGAAKALCIVARDADGRPADIMAWCPKQDRVAAHLGRVALLGEQNVNGWRAGEPLVVHRSVLGWLRDERRGVVVADEKRAWRALESVEVVAEDLDHGKALRRILSAPAPRILLQQPEAA